MGTWQLLVPVVLWISAILVELLMGGPVIMKLLITHRTVFMILNLEDRATKSQKMILV